jgi:hypothetical protein
MDGFIFVTFVVAAALFAGFKSRTPGKLPGALLIFALSAAAGAYLYA